MTADRDAPRDAVVVQVDGGARGNPGPAAIAAVATAQDGEPLAERSAYIGEATNNVAEYRALLLGLELARELGAPRVEVVNDSELVARQVGGQYKVKHAGLRPLYEEAMERLRRFDRWSVHSVSRAENARADALVNAALDDALGNGGKGTDTDLEDEPEEEADSEADGVPARVDFEAERLLDGLEEAGERAARTELLQQLSDAGVSLDELRRAVADNRLGLLPVERVLSGEGERYTAVEAAERSGLDLEVLVAHWAALGLPRPAPDDRVFAAGDVEVARILRGFRDAGMSHAAQLDATRVLGRGMSQFAAAVRQIFGEAFLRAGDTERDLGLRYAEAASAMMPQMGRLLERAFALHMLEQTRLGIVDRSSLETGRLPGGQPIAACFADLVGFTRIGEHLPPEEVGAVAGRLSELAADVAVGSVQLIKMIGDAAMLVSRDVDDMLEAALALVDAADAEGEAFPQVHAGVAAGEALTRAGDWYGRPVNLASRLSAIARPGSVLATAEVREAATREFAWSGAGARRIKGVEGRVGLYRVRRPREDGADRR